MVRDFLESKGFRVPDDIGLVFSPERMVEGQAIGDFMTLPKIIGASDERSRVIADKVIASLGGPVCNVSTVTAAEMVKMVDNYSRYAFLGLTNEIALMCEKVGVDVLEVIAAAKKEYPRNAGILIPGPGVGGSCLNKDPFILRAHMRREDLFLRMVEAASIVNRSMPAHVVELVTKFAGKRRSVTIAGVSFKGDTDDTRFSPSFEIAASLEKLGFSVVMTDPFVKLDSMKVNAGILDSVRNSDILLILTDHNEYKSLDLEKVISSMTKNPLIIDTRGVIDRKKAEMTGFEYHGLGRL